MKNCGPNKNLIHILNIYSIAGQNLINEQITTLATVLDL